MFILVGAGIVGGIGLIIVEILYHKHKMRRAKRTETAKVAFTRWKGTIEVSFYYLSSKQYIHVTSHWMCAIGKILVVMCDKIKPLHENLC